MAGRGDSCRGALTPRSTAGGAVPSLSDDTRPRVQPRRDSAGRGTHRLLRPRIVRRRIVAGPLAASYLRGGIAQRRTDLLDIELDDRALLALAGLVDALLQPALRDDPHAAGQRFGGVLGGL